MTAAHALPRPVAPAQQQAWRPRIAEPDVIGLPVTLWFTEAHHAGALIPAVTLAARTGGGVPAGALLPPQGDRGVLIGAIRWQLRSGLVETVDVPPAFLGRGADEVLAAAAGALIRLRRWPALTGDRTERRPRTGPRGVERLIADLVPRLI